MIPSGRTKKRIQKAAGRVDRFEWADYMLGYVNSTLTVETDETIRQQADVYAASRISAMRTTPARKTSESVSYPSRRAKAVCHALWSEET